MTRKNVYLDNAATTPMDPKVIEKISSEMTNDFGNASSQHAFGRKARQVVEAARHQLAETINAEDKEIIFTSGGSESNNTAIFGTARARKKIGKKIITTKIEHPSVLNPMKRLAQEGYEIVYLDVDEAGHINLKDLKRELTPDTILVSVMAVNNEVGSIMPLKEIGELVKDSNAYFHVDDVQGFGNIEIDVKDMNIDLLSTSAHKVNGPKFLGFLYEKNGLNVSNLLLGGEQELKRRPGTENVPGIAGFGVAAQELREMDKKQLQENYRKFQQIILDELDQNKIDYEINGSLKGAVSHHVLNLWLKGVGTYSALTNLDLNGYAVSGGSACTAGSLNPSHVLEAMYGEDSPRIEESIRISFGRFTTADEVKDFADSLVKMCQRLSK
ncbi:cysteine desulfurase family protein [Lactobacillus paragasseri]|uniref:cysteine desulfurase family protein n=1 Tax=Lactobacillus paragasseri TaxID=2107999 RepID=UPI0012E14F6F|nr:cysteine desulfurase family protein [Lactobacillus paragasseri]MDK8086691.1 cysteine desulfurase family protein [Lactobacillus paragasseri]MDX5118775.1 cysteine desulfurase family protein [Lactobacillus paragasseri]MDX5122401.1 cysteine desulfurase family protein [Lactobacillus paragasseri]QGT97908.1 cysteine desulfurase [Lactobacillus paragasseri]UWI47333.1 cysteine desulfurase [Lactobacillus paragasseri]